MPKKKLPKKENQLAQQISWLMFFRVVTNTFLLVTTVVVQYRQSTWVSDDALAALYVLIASTYFLTFLYALVLPRFAGWQTQAYLQIIGDVCLNTVIIYLTGGLESAFSFMYILTIINAGVLLKIKGAALVASLSAILYGALLDLHYYNYIHPFLTRFSHMTYYRATDILSTIVVNMGAFYLVGFLSGYLALQAEESRKKLAERQSDLERLEHLNASIVQSIDSGLMTLSRQGLVLSVNPAAERITGFSFSAIRGRKFSDLFPGIVLPENPDELGPGENTWSGLHENARGEHLWLEMGLLGLQGRTGEKWGRLMVIQDKTRIRQMEEEVKKVEKLALIGELAASIAHEIRNPLASMSASFQMLKSDITANQDQARLMTIIHREMERLTFLVDDFLLFARPRAGTPMPMDLSKVIEETLDMFINQIGSSAPIQVRKDIQPGVWVNFDRQQLEQVVWNLLRNGVEAMPEGGILTVGVTRTKEPAHLGVILVQDTGIGIPPEVMSQIFDPFFTTKKNGNGLGLSIVLRILESGGGRIEVNPLAEGGTAFRIMLPGVDPA